MTIFEGIHGCRPFCLLGTQSTRAPCPLTIYGDQKGIVACNMKTIDLIKQFQHAPADPNEPPTKQQKALAPAIMMTPKVTLPTPFTSTPTVIAKRDMDKRSMDPETSKAGKDRAKALALQQPQALVLPVPQAQELNLIGDQTTDQTWAKVADKPDDTP